METSILDIVTHHNPVISHLQAKDEQLDGSNMLRGKAKLVRALA